MPNSTLATKGSVNGTEAGQEREGSPSPDAQAPRTQSGTPLDTMLGHVVWLMMNISAYRHVFIADLEWMVLPPLALNQYRLFRADNRVVAFAAWAHLSEAAEARLQEPNPRLAPAEWKSGDRLWLVNLFAPFGHQEAALKELCETALADKSFKMHRRGADGVARVETVQGVKLRGSTS
jgi:cytolysin-activating lysine-acyltransferase